MLPGVPDLLLLINAHNTDARVRQQEIPPNATTALLLFGSETDGRMVDGRIAKGTRIASLALGQTRR